MTDTGTTRAGYALTKLESAEMGAPQIGQHFALQDTFYTLSNSSTKSPFGTSSVDQQKYDAANHAMFNPYENLGVTCTTVSMAAGRPDLDITGAGGACPMSSPGMEAAMIENNRGYNVYGPPATQVLLAEGDVRYSYSRFSNKNYTGPSLSDYTMNVRLMGTRDVAESGCSVNADSGITSCALQSDPLPFPTSDDPRTNYGASNIHGSYWDSLKEDHRDDAACDAHGGASLCGLHTVEAGAPPQQLPLYTQKGSK